MFNHRRLGKLQRQLKDTTTAQERARALVALGDAWGGTSYEDHEVICALLKTIAHLYDPNAAGGIRMDDLATRVPASQVTPQLRGAFSGTAQALTMGNRADALEAFEVLYDHIAKTFTVNAAEGSAGTVLAQIYGSYNGSWVLD